MNALSADRDAVRHAGAVIAGLVAGGTLAYVDGGIVPPVLVIGATVVAMLLVERYGL